jgi:predicted NAD/FAD-binding protein
VALFERHPRPGFIAHSVDVDAGHGRLRVDVPIRVFYAGYYPTLVKLYAELGVATEAVSYASSFHDERGQLFFRYRNWLAGGGSYSWVAPQDFVGTRGAATRRIVAGALAFRRRAPGALARGELAGMTLGEYLRHAAVPDAFVHGLLLPAVATICTCAYEDALRFPAAVIVDYLARGLTREPVRRAAAGADDVAQRLCMGIRAGTGAGIRAGMHAGAHGGANVGSEVLLAQRLQGLRREEPGAATGSRSSAGAGAGPGPGRGVALRLADGSVRRFHHVVLATQANQALALLDDATAAERAVLAAFSYRPVEVVMHRDARLLPARPSQWSAVNLLVTPGQAQPQSTIWVNAVQPALAASAHRAPIFQTVHPLQAPREELVISHARFERPVVNAASELALQGLARLHAEPARRVWFCGSYAQPGIPLLESAVRSAELAARAVAAAVDAAGDAAGATGAAGERAGAVDAIDGAASGSSAIAAVGAPARPLYST